MAAAAGTLTLLLPFLPDDDAGALDTLLALDGTQAVVRRQKIWEVVSQHEFQVNNLLDDEYEPRPSRVIVRDACRMAGRVLRYSLTSFNCEHFVTSLRYGKPESRQVRSQVHHGRQGAS